VFYNCSRYNQRHQPAIPLGIEWEESSERYTDYLLAISMINLTHPGWGRALPDPIQILCSERILLGLNVGNLLLDGGIMWGEGVLLRDIRARITAMQTPAGYTAFQIGQK
jgi:hypothetical protein